MSSSKVLFVNTDEKDLVNLNQIIEVYSYNLEEEISKISHLIDKYKYISMDTEFPGIVLNTNYSNNSPESIYSKIKLNIDHLKLIQIGFTLSDKNGRFPKGIKTWQFNMDFDINIEKYNQDSINLLINSGINFENLPKQGIPPNKLAELLLTSGLILNEDIHWITFHGSYDLAYFLKLITNQLLPDKLELFMSDLDFYFNNFYDIRYLVKNELKGNKLSLNKLASDFMIERTGTQHQAGSDSLLTSSVYFKVIQNVLNEMDLINGKNKLYCLSNSEEEELGFHDGYKAFNNCPYNGVGFQGYNQSFLFGGNLGGNMGNINQLNGMNMGNLGNLNNYQFYNMMMNSSMKILQSCEASSNSSFNSGSSTASSNSFTQQVPVTKKKKSKKEKKKASQKKTA